ncbi:MAG: rod shape-determining protein MreC [bacterium]|nr:rod shape-determining protein MreC [bacterium]
MQKKKTKKIITILLVLLGLVLFSFLVSNKTKNLFHLVLSPLENYLWQKNNSSLGFVACVFNHKEILEENEALKQENVSLLTKLNDLKNMAQENEALRKLNDLESKKGFSLLLAKITSRGIEGDSLVINKGLKDGLQVGFTALNGAGALLGSLSEVLDNSSRITLITSPNQTFDISIKSEAEVLALAQGKGDLNLSFQFALKEENLSSKDLVFTSGLGGKFPSDILVGYLEEIRKNEAEKFQEGTLKPYFLETTLNQVFIVTNFLETMNNASF